MKSAKLNKKDVFSILSGVQKKQTNDKKKQAERKKVASTATARKPTAARSNLVTEFGQQMKLVLELARKEKKPLPYAHILTKIRVDIDASPRLVKAMQAHESIIVDDISRTVKYRTKHSITSREQMLELTRKNYNGIPAAELKDAYIEAEADLQALADDEQVFIVQNKDAATLDPMVVYPNPMPMPGEVDEEIRVLLQSVELPADESRIEAALAAAGIRKAKRSTARLKVATITDNLNRGRSKKKAAIRNLTNAHMMHLFENEQGSID